jgi:alkylated DNA repair dioxygenase AlkB
VSDLPTGFVYRPDFLTPEEERVVLAGVRTLEFQDVSMRGQVARRRTAHFGWTYVYETWRIEPGPPIPEFLLALRARVGAVGAAAAEDLAEVLVTHYPPGAGIGWHRDAPMFGVVVGVSLAGACRLRFQRGTGAGRCTAAAVLAPRSAYALDGTARWQWQHSIPPGKTERYSVTYRTLRRSPRSVP